MEREETNKLLVSNHSKTSKKSEYKTSALTIHTPLFIDINKRGLWFSVNYLSELHNAYKKLKLKHSNSVQSFEALLGIK